MERRAVRTGTFHRVAFGAVAVALTCSLGPAVAPASAVPGDAQRMRELASVAVHPWRLEIHRRAPNEPSEPREGGPLSLLVPPPPPPPIAEPETRERTFAELEALGVRNARVDLSWCHVEPEPPTSGAIGEPASEPGLGEGLLGGGADKPPEERTLDGRDWSIFDSIVASARRHGVTLMPVVSCVPGWANGNQHYFTYPTDMSSFQRFFEAALRRYPQIRAWEIWNEPNYEAFARPEPRVAPFVELLRSAHAARVAAGSDAKLVSGGLASVGKVDMFTFFEGMADQGALELIDGLGVHPYSTASPESARSLFMRLPELRRRLVERGKPHIGLWLTEYGVPDSTRRSGYGQPGDETRQAELLRRAYAIAARWPWVANVTWYEARDDCDDVANADCRLGLMRPTFAPKRAALALRELLAGGDFPLLPSSTTAGVSRMRPAAASRTRRPQRPRYRLSGTVFAPGEDVSGRAITVRLRRLSTARRGPRRRVTWVHRPRLRAGAYSVALPRLRPGRYRIVAIFAGGPRHAGSSQSRELTVRARR